MPRIKSSVKDVRKNRAQREINRQGLSKLRTVMKSARTAEAGEAPVALTKAAKVIDKAIQNGLIHKNTGARYKSRIAKAQNKTVAAAKA